MVNASAAGLRLDIDIMPLCWRTELSAMRNGSFPFVLGADYHGNDWDFVYPYSPLLLNKQVIVICAPDSMDNGGHWRKNF